MKPMAISSDLSHKMANMSLVCAILIVSQHVFTMACVPPRGTGLWWFFCLFRGVFTEIGVPYFFLAAGFFLSGHVCEEGWLGRETGKRVRTLLVPFFLWSILTIVIRIVGFAASNLATHKFWTAGLDFSFHYFYHLQYFLRSLFVFVLLSGVLVALIRRLRAGAIFLLFGCYYALAAVGVAGDMAHYLFPIHGIAYFSLGIYLRIGGWRIDRPRLLYGLSWIALGVCYVVRILALHRGAQSAIAFYCTVPLAMIAVWSIMPCAAWPKKLTSCSFPIYLLHPFCLYFMYGIAGVLGYGDIAGRSAVAYVLAFLLATAGCFALTFALRRFTPKMSEVMFGGR